MTEKSTSKESVESSKEHKKILTVIIVLVVAAIGLYILSVSKTNTNSATSGDVNNGNSNVAVSQAPVEGNSELTSKKWIWINTKMNDGAVTMPSKAGTFTATFQDDNRLVATTDCNNGNASYELGPDNSLTIGPMASTMMFCEESNQDAYFQQLGNIGSYKISNGELWLMLKYDSGTMIFK